MWLTVIEGRTNLVNDLTAPCLPVTIHMTH
jgi:hypothetical protein